MITYRRPDGLTRLLDGLEALSFKEETPSVRVVVVDNDPDGTARELCEAHGRKSRWDMCYQVESQRGIPFARNTAIRLALESADLVAFIDDDEIPEPQWLDELLRVADTYGADVVGGPVVPHFTEPPPAWIMRGGFYNRPRHETGQTLDRAFTGNILFRRAVLDDMDSHFDERMAMTGGSDSLFLQRVHRAGHMIVWADDAVAHEWLPASRIGARWILQRAYRYGTVNAFIRRDLLGFPKAVLVSCAAACVRTASGLILVPLTLLRGRPMAIRGLRHLFYAGGLLMGLFGVKYHEYRRTHSV